MYTASYFPQSVPVEKKLRYPMKYQRSPEPDSSSNSLASTFIDALISVFNLIFISGDTLNNVDSP